MAWCYYADGYRTSFTDTAGTTTTYSRNAAGRIRTVHNPRLREAQFTPQVHIPKSHTQGRIFNDWELKLTEPRLDVGIRLLLKLSTYLEEYGKGTAANRFQRWADELKTNPSKKDLYEVCRGIIEALGAGSGRVTDIYFAHPDGRPNIERTNDYMETIQAVRRFARRAVPPRSYFLR